MPCHISPFVHYFQLPCDGKGHVKLPRLRSKNHTEKESSSAPYLAFFRRIINPKQNKCIGEGVYAFYLHRAENIF